LSRLTAVFLHDVLAKTWLHWALKVSVFSAKPSAWGSGNLLGW